MAKIGYVGVAVMLAAMLAGVPVGLVEFLSVLLLAALLASREIIAVGRQRHQRVLARLRAWHLLAERRSPGFWPAVSGRAAAEQLEGRLLDIRLVQALGVLCLLALGFGTLFGP